jgi:hypothetical protein
MFWKPRDLDDLCAGGTRDEKWTVLPIVHIEVILRPLLVLEPTEHARSEILRGFPMTILAVELWSL